jgi:hypothetical protein
VYALILYFQTLYQLHRLCSVNYTMVMNCELRTCVVAVMTCSKVLSQHLPGGLEVTDLETEIRTRNLLNWTFCFKITYHMYGSAGQVFVLTLLHDFSRTLTIYRGCFNNEDYLAGSLCAKCSSECGDDL